MDHPLCSKSRVSVVRCVFYLTAQRDEPVSFAHRKTNARGMRYCSLHEICFTASISVSKRCILYKSDVESLLTVLVPDSATMSAILLVPRRIVLIRPSWNQGRKLRSSRFLLRIRLGTWNLESSKLQVSMSARGIVPTTACQTVDFQLLEAELGARSGLAPKLLFCSNLEEKIRNLGPK